MALPADAAMFGCTCTDIFDTPEALDEHIRERRREQGIGGRRHDKWLLACRPCFKMSPRNPRWFFQDNPSVLLGHYKQYHGELLVPNNVTRSTFGGNHQHKITPDTQNFKQIPAQAVQPTPASTIGENRQLGTPSSIYEFKGASAQAGQPVPVSDISKEMPNRSWYKIPLTHFSAVTHCPDCSTKLNSAKAARRHYSMTGHGRSRLCLPCARFFWTERDLVQHQRSSIHSNMNRYQKVAVVDPTPASAIKPSPQPTKLVAASQVPQAPTPPTTATKVNPPPLAPAPLTPTPDEDEKEGIDLDAVFLQIQEQMGIPEENHLTLGDESASGARPHEPARSSTSPAPKRAKTKHSPFAVPITKIETTLYYCNTCLRKLDTVADLERHLAMGHQQRQPTGLPERLSLSPNTNG